jgi:alkylation response protein AidB-like acyl-CoA dehydrogenase
MLLELTGEQQFFRETTATFLEAQVPVGEIRRLRDDPAGFEEKYWQSGAELGWTSLLVSEEHGGGTISGRGCADLTLVAYEFGKHAAPGPLISTNVVAAALSATGADEEVLAGLLAGTSVASWCPVALGQHGGGDEIKLQIRKVGTDVVLSGTTRPLESAGQADHFLVAGRTGEGLTQLLVPADATGASIRPLRSVDLTRRFGEVVFDEVRLPAEAVVGEIGGAGELLEHQLQLALIMLTAEAVGAMQAAFDMTVQWAFDRYSFGRPLASYQALKHRFADMMTWLEASHAISDSAAAAVDTRSPNATEMVSAAKAYIGLHGTELAQECVQLHGGIGVTFEHDLHLYLRRLTLNRALYGTPADHRQRIATYIENQEGPVQ